MKIHMLGENINILANIKQQGNKSNSFSRGLNVQKKCECLIKNSIFHIHSIQVKFIHLTPTQILTEC